MNTLTDRLLKVQEQVTRLVREHQVVQTRASELEVKARDNQRTAEVLKARVTELEKENEVLRKGRSTEGGTNAPGTKERIDELVHEIDHCLALLKS